MSTTPQETSTLPPERAPIRSALYVALGVGILSVMGPTLPLPPAVLFLPSFIAVVIIGVMPFIVAGSAARLMVRRASSTSPSERSYTGYLLSALYQLHIPLAVLAGLVPAIAIQGARVARETIISLNAGCMDGCMWPLFMPEPDFDRLDSLLRIFFAGWGISHLGVSWMAATLGSSMALWRLRVGQAVILSAALMLVPLSVLYLSLPGVLFSILEVSTDAAQSNNLPARWAAVYGIAPFILGFLILGLVQTLHKRSSAAG